MSVEEKLLSYSSPEVNVHVNATVTCVGGSVAVAGTAYLCDRMGVGAGGTAVASLIVNQAVQWILPSVMHFKANRAAFMNEDTLDAKKAAGSIMHYHVSGLIPGLLYNTLAVAGQYWLQEKGVDSTMAGFSAYAMAIPPTRLIHHVIASRSGLYEGAKTPVGNSQ